MLNFKEIINKNLAVYATEKEYKLFFVTNDEKIIKTPILVRNWENEKQSVEEIRETILSRENNEFDMGMSKFIYATDISIDITYLDDNIMVVCIHDDGTHVSLYIENNLESYCYEYNGLYNDTKTIVKGDTYEPLGEDVEYLK